MVNKTLFTFIIFFIWLPLSYSGKPTVFATDEGAIRGHDPVAYFTDGKPVKGSDEHTLEWSGTLFKFASSENLALFQADPEKYAPQYGGYCAYAVSEGYTASTVPEAWDIVDGKLYLNYSLSVKRKWSKNIPERIAAANQNWPAVLQ